MVSRRTPLSPKKRQLSGIVGGLGLGSSNGNGNGNSGGNGNNQNALAASSVDAATVATTPAAATVPVGATTPAKTAVATTPVATTAPKPVTTSTTSTTPSSSTTPTSTADSTTSSAALGTTITRVITPTTVIVVGTQTFTSALPVTTVTSASTSSDNVSRNNSSLSTGAKAGIIAGSVVGGVALLAIFLFVCLAARRKRKNDQDAKDNIIWPSTAVSADDRAALYPESTHPTGRSGLGSDEMEETRSGAGSSIMGVGGAGAAGIGAAYAGAGRYNPHSTYAASGRQPTLPSVAPSAYDDDGTYNGLSHSQSYNMGSNNLSAPASAYTLPSTYAYNSPPSSNQGPGPASIDYHRQTPSPPRTFGQPGGSSSGHGFEPAVAPLPLPGSEDDHHHEQEKLARPSSPTPMNVGAFGEGYPEGNPGSWRLSVVNDGR